MLVRGIGLYRDIPIGLYRDIPIGLCIITTVITYSCYNNYDDHCDDNYYDNYQDNSYDNYDSNYYSNCYDNYNDSYCSARLAILCTCPPWQKGLIYLKSHLEFVFFFLCLFRSVACSYSHLTLVSRLILLLIFIWQGVEPSWCHQGAF